MSKPIPLGMCQCGCGQPTKIATRTATAYGHVKGEPLRYRNGHYPRPSAEQRLWGRLDRSGPCWVWTGGCDRKGYGLIRVDNELHRVHRLVWEMNNGPIPDGLWVLHRCDNPPCCNPDHLFVGTHQDNMRDMAEKGRAAPPRGTQHFRAKLNPETVREIRSRVASGETQKSVARDLGVSLPTVNHVIRGRTWAHVA